MKFFLLDGAGALIIIIPILIVAMFVVILVEAGIIVYFKLNNFKRALAYSSIVNIASLAVGFVLVPALERRFHNEIEKESLWVWLLFFITTVLTEGLLLMLMIKKAPKQKVWLAVIVMNVITYLLLYLFVVYFLNRF